MFCFECVVLSCSGIEDGVVESFCSVKKKYVFYFMKYKFEINFWEEILFFDVGFREGICIVVKDSFIYFVGGR